MIIITLRHTLCVKKKTVNQLDTLKKNIIKQKKDLRDISTSTLQIIIIIITLIRI